VTAFDNGTPSLENITTVIVNVNRNQNSPRFAITSSIKRLSEETALGTLVETVSATDDDLTVSILFLQFIYNVSYHKSLYPNFVC
jgi:hypothetical protein